MSYLQSARQTAPSPSAAQRLCRTMKACIRCARQWLTWPLRSEQLHPNGTQTTSIGTCTRSLPPILNLSRPTQGECRRKAPIRTPPSPARWRVGTPRLPTGSISHRCRGAAWPYTGAIAPDQKPHSCSGHSRHAASPCRSNFPQPGPLNPGPALTPQHTYGTDPGSTPRYHVYAALYLSGCR